MRDVTRIRPEKGAYRAYTLNNYKSLPQVQELSRGQRHAIDVVGNVFPFKCNNYVAEQLIDWSDSEDPMYVLTFPQKDMLTPEHFSYMEHALQTESKEHIRRAAHDIRLQLNPHPAGQKHNVPTLADGRQLPGIQHKYEQTVLFFPSQGQTCHAYCSFCFRWPQFVGMPDMKFAMKEAHILVQYLKEHPEATNVLFTGGDPMVMSARALGVYVDAILEADLPHIRSIRFGSKALSYWPYRFVTDSDADELLALFRKIQDHGKHPTFIAHFNHTKELSTAILEEAVARIRETGAVIRTQSPILRHINDDADVWTSMWQRQLQLGMVPYLMFMTRDTGAQHYFGLPLVQGVEVFQRAIRRIGGIGRTVRGFVMSALPGKVQVLDVVEMGGRKYLALRFVQGRNMDWTYKVFFAEYDENALWLDDLKPAFGEKEFFFEHELKEMLELETDYEAA